MGVITLTGEADAPDRQIATLRTGEATRRFPPKTAPETEIGATATATGDLTGIP